MSELSARIAWHVEQARWHQEKILELTPPAGTMLPRLVPPTVDPYALPATFYGGKRKRRSSVAWTNPNYED